MNSLVQFFHIVGIIRIYTGQVGWFQICCFTPPLAMSRPRPRHGLQNDEIMSLYGGHELYPAVAGSYWLRKLEFEHLPLFLAGGSVQSCFVLFFFPKTQC